MSFVEGLVCRVAACLGCSVQRGAAVLLLIFLAPQASAQAFQPLTLTGSEFFETPADTDFWINAVAPGDVDGDGDLDLAVIGFYVVYNESVEDVLVVFRNEGSAETGWSFTEQRLPLDRVRAGASDLAWGDYDNDGDLDLAVGSEGSTLLYQNNAGTLTNASTTPRILPGYGEESQYTGAYDLRSITWADIDNDGDLDLLLPSIFDEQEFEYSSRVLRNDGNDSGSWAFTSAKVGIDPALHAQSAWADDDRDSDVDLFLANIDPNEDSGFIKRFENRGGSFVGEDLLGIRVQYGSADWGDYDADGDLDILVAGNIREDDDTFDTVLRIYRNDGHGYTSLDLPAPRERWLDLHAATWADYDADGDVDLLATGTRLGDEGIQGVSAIYRNRGGTLMPLSTELPAPVTTSGRGGAFTWFDLDRDGDLDYLVAGAYYAADGGGTVEAQLNVFRNDAPADDLQPTVPGPLAAQTESDGIALAWIPATDDATPRKALTYDLEIRPAGKGFGRSKREPAPGTLGAVSRWRVALPPGRYEWSVRAVDAAFNAGARRKGTLAVPAAKEGLRVSAEPIDQPISVPAAGGDFRYRLEIANSSRTWKAFEVWTTTRQPDGKMRTVKKLTGSVAAGGKFRTIVHQKVPKGLAPGRYMQTVSVQRRASTGSSDTFSWTKRGR